MRGLAVLMLLAGASLPALAQTEVGDPASGLRLATTWCASCHQVTPGGAGPSGDAAPSFRSIARMPSTTSMSLRVFLQTPHPNMPDFHLSREELDDVVAYLISLQR
ncbi:c-type cytochrome [Neoroseomonas lacus]|uniref:Cytochrome c-552 n=1 Tax=Neoroseomonas lacus TaxID=287609 RepID=A0A917KX66_9PROT|nr:cytochrome c [Neoroseomonas lacus]GGJ32407.1 cytochrome c-552 [Neoroseomonas lacus]